MRPTPPPLESEAVSEGYVDEVLDGQGEFLYLDILLSVSELAEAEADAFYGVQIDMFDEGDPHGS